MSASLDSPVNISAEKRFAFTFLLYKLLLQFLQNLSLGLPYYFTSILHNMKTRMVNKMFILCICDSKLKFHIYLAYKMPLPCPSPRWCIYHFLLGCYIYLNFSVYLYSSVILLQLYVSLKFWIPYLMCPFTFHVFLSWVVLECFYLFFLFLSLPIHSNIVSRRLIF